MFYKFFWRDNKERGKRVQGAYFLIEGCGRNLLAPVSGSCSFFRSIGGLSDYFCRKTINMEDTKRDNEGMLLLYEARESWERLAPVRAKRERNKNFTYGSQWGDSVADEKGMRVSEYDFQKRSGKEPLTNNLIRQLVKSVVGRFRQRLDSVRIAETLSGNRVKELDSRLMEEFLISGCCFQRIDFGDGRMAVRLDNVSPDRIFLNFTDDPRGWDCDLIGQLHDMTLAEIVGRFGDGNREKALELCSFYRQGGLLESEGCFGHSPRRGRVRVVELWRKESREGYDCHDLRSGRWYFRAGIDHEEREWEERSWRIEAVWRCYWLTPAGDIISQYDSPYGHRSHPFAYRLYPLVGGEIHSLVEDVIDQQKYVNRLITLVDHVMSASAKGVLLYPDTILPDGFTWDDLRYAWSKPNSIVPYHPQGSGDHPQQISVNATDIGAYEMVNLQMRLFEQISGVSGALQGRPADASTGVRLYESQIANSTVALSDIFESFDAFRQDRDEKGAHVSC